jgi:hypothetical protein
MSNTAFEMMRSAIFEIMSNTDFDEEEEEEEAEEQQRRPSTMEDFYDIIERYYGDHIDHSAQQPRLSGREDISQTRIKRPTGWSKTFEEAAYGSTRTIN